MKKSICTTLAVTLIASNLSVISFANETTTSSTIVSANNFSRGKLEIDINFSLPIKFVDSKKTNINVLLKSEDNEYSIDLGSDNLSGKDNSINYTLRALDETKNIIKGDDVNFYHLEIDNLEVGNYSVKISGEGYQTVNIDNVEISKTSKRIELGTADKTTVIDENTSITYDSVFMAGDVDANNLVTTADYEKIKEIIKSRGYEISADLNRDSKVDILDLSYVHENIDKIQKNPTIIDTNPIIDINSIRDISTNGDTDDDLINLFTDENTLTIKQEEDISKDNHIDIPIFFNEVQIMEQVKISLPDNENAPTEGIIVVNGEEFEFNKNLSRSVDLENVITIDLGKQVAVSEITIIVTGTRSNKNLAEIAKVEFLNDVYTEMPKPNMNVPVINSFTSKTQVGKEELNLSWNHEPNVDAYEVKLQLLGDSGTIVQTSKFKTSQNTLTVPKVEPYGIYRVSIQSLSGTTWESGYKDEQDDYDVNKTGNTNLQNNSNDKDGFPDNVDKNYQNHGWDANTGLLKDNAGYSVSNAYNETLKDGSNYGKDSIIELQIVPESKPGKPEQVRVQGNLKSLTVTWGTNSQAKDFDIYYRKLGDGAFIKANDPNNDYVDTDPTNDVPDNAYNIDYDKKTDHDELIKGNIFKIDGLLDNETYEIRMIATNHHGSGAISETYLGTTSNLQGPTITSYNLINTPKESYSQYESPVNGIIDITYPNGSTNIDDKFAIVDGNIETHWTSNTWNTNYNTGPIITFDKVYDIDTVRIATRYDDGYGGGGIYDYVPVRYYDIEKNEFVQINASFKQIKDENNVLYYEVNLPNKITTSKLQISLRAHPAYTPLSSISEIKLYKYDSLKDDVDALFDDSLQLTLKDNVTKEKIDNLRIQANMKDENTNEENPYKETALESLERAQLILEDNNLNERLITIDPNISNSWSGNQMGQSNDWQALGVAVKPGDTVNIYIGSSRELQNTTFELGISQHNGETESAFKSYNQILTVGKNEIVIPENDFNIDSEKGGNLYIRMYNRSFANTESIKVRVSGGVEIPHIKILDEIDNKNRETYIKEEIRNYIKNLKTYVELLPSHYPEIEDKANNIYKYNPQTSILNSTEIELKKITLSLPADQILKGITEGASSEEEQVEKMYQTLCALDQLVEISHSHQGLIYDAIDFDGDGKITNNPLDILGGISESTFHSRNKGPTNRINIKYQRMFTGAFMYASSHHIGIKYETVPQIMNGKAFEFDENGNLLNIDGNLFGWGISHEIGHIHDVNGLTYEETTNNILALITQTFNGISSSRLEDMYDDIYKRVTSNGISTPQGFVGLGMFWQLHLAYDNHNNYELLQVNSDNDINNDSFYAKLYRETRLKGIAPVEDGYDRTAQTFIIRSSDAVKKDLREFFLRWGIPSSPKTNEYLDSVNYEKETKDIFYLNDNAHRQRLENVSDMSKDVKVTANFGSGISDNSYVKNKEIPLEFSVNKDNDKILGYEIIRKESTNTGIREIPVGFVENTGSVTKYTDVIDNMNNRVLEYKVKAYDFNLNHTETFDIGTVKVTHDGNLPKRTMKISSNTVGVDEIHNDESGHGHIEGGSVLKVIDDNKESIYEAIKSTDCSGHASHEDPYIVLDLVNSNQVVGLKYTPGGENKITDYEVLVSKDGVTWDRAHSGVFSTEGESTIYFNELGNDDNNQLWSYNAKYVKLVSKGKEKLSLAEIDLLSQPGDNIEIGVDNNDNVYKNGIGRLVSDFEYASGRIIPKDSIIVLGEYRGNPAFNAPLVLNENGENFALESQAILLANLPEGSELGEIAEGNYIYWITKEQEEKIIDGMNNIEGSKIKTELYRYNGLDENSRPINQRLVSDSFYVDLPSDLNDLDSIDLTSQSFTSRKSIFEFK